MAAEIRSIDDILGGKRLGRDCSEDESAALKQFMRSNDDATTAEARRLFPIESDEQLAEDLRDFA